MFSIITQLLLTSQPLYSFGLFSVALTVTKLADEYVAVPLNDAGMLHCLVKLNESGAEVFRGLTDEQDEEQIVQRLMKKYPELDSETAHTAVLQVIDELKNAGILTE